MPTKCPYSRLSDESLTERHVQALWYDRMMRPEKLITSSGESVNVIDPGEWNLGAGPDFKNAVLEIGADRHRLQGDVEIHLTPQDWDAHGHGTDPAYNHVILHVVWLSGPHPRTLPDAVQTVWLGRYFVSRPSFSPEQIDLTEYPFERQPTVDRPCAVRFAGHPEQARAVLMEAGAYRLKKKAARLAEELLSRPFAREQIFYEEVMAAMGYHDNSAGFRLLAEAVPYDRLMSEPAYAAQALLSASEFITWNRAACRPNNLPEARVETAAQLWAETDIMDLIDQKDFTPGACKEICEKLCANHLMGMARAAAILANVIVPFALAEGRLVAVPNWLPAEELSSPVRLTAFRMFGRDHNPAVLYSRNGLAIQGLLQIHREYCLVNYPACENCEFGRMRPASIA